MIIAVDTNNSIGDAGIHKLKWKMSSDLKRFKRLTENNVVIMGFNTFVSIGKPLPNRFNIIITRNHQDDVDKILSKHNSLACVEDSLESALSVFEHSLHASYSNSCFLIGGASLYNEAIEKDLIDEMYITRICNDSASDTLVNIPNMTQPYGFWEKQINEVNFAKTENDEYESSFYVLKRTNKNL